MTKSKARPTRILHITFNMGFGGTEQVIRQLVTNLNKNRFHNEIACIDGEVGAIGQALETECGIKHHARQRASGFDLKTILWLRQLIKSGKFDIVHCHQYSPYAYGWFAHVAISSATRDALVEYEYLPRNRISVIYNGIAPLEVTEKKRSILKDELGIRAEETVIGTVARLDAVKNQALMLKATRALLDQDFPVRLLLVGDGPERDNLEKLAAELNLGESVIFTGFQSEPADYLSLMDIFLLPSFTEGTSMTLLEAMSLGITTVATRVGGTPEIVADGETGKLFESNDLPAFTRAIQELLQAPDALSKMSQQARRRFEKRFSAEQMVQQYEHCYQ